MFFCNLKREDPIADIKKKNIGFSARRQDVSIDGNIDPPNIELEGLAANA
jgi:hypothetical protein